MIVTEHQTKLLSEELVVVSDSDCCSSSSEEEASVSSTQSVDSHNRKRRRLPDSKNTNQRCVQFDLTRNTEYDSTHGLCKATIAKELYYSSWEYRQFKNRQAESIQKHYQNEQRQVFYDDKDEYYHEEPLTMVLERVYQTCAEFASLDEQDERDLEAAVRLDTLGLEGRLALSWKLDRRRRRRELYDAILDLQEEAAPCVNDYDALALLVAEASRQRSQPSRVFAAYLAQAQYFGA